MEINTKHSFSLFLFSIYILLNSCQSPARAEVKEVLKSNEDIAEVMEGSVEKPIEEAMEVKKDTITIKKEKKVEKTSSLTLTFNNLESVTAPVVVGIYGTKNKFPDPKDQMKEYKFKPRGKKILTVKIPNLKFGTYALAIYQDVNSSGKIDKNMIGIPTEPYAFSNNYKPKVRAPNFNDCKFTYDTKNNSISMNMIH